MTAANTTNQSVLLKRLYPEGVSFPAFKRSKFLAKMKTDTRFGGLGRHVNVTIAPTTGGSAAFSEALANQGATNEKQFFLVHRKEYQVGSVQNDLIHRAMGNKNAIVEAIKQQLDKARYAFGRNRARRAWGNGGGALGVIGSLTTTTTANDTINLATRADIVGFFPGMWVQLASDDGSGTSPAGTRAGGAKAQIQGVVINDGSSPAVAQLVFSTTLTDLITGATSGDSIFRSGDYSVAWTGVRGWNPITAPTTGDSFMSLDRFAAGNVEALSGLRTGAAATKEDTLINASAEAELHGYQMDECWVSPLDMKDLIKEVGAKRFYEGKTNVPGISFKGLELDTPSGMLVVISDADVPQGYFWMFPSGNWTCRSAGEVPMFLNKVGTGPGMLLTASDDDAHQFRLGAYGNNENGNPGEAVIGTF